MPIAGGRQRRRARRTRRRYWGRPATPLKKAVVTVNGKPLPLRLDLGKISLSGFNWGYGGAGPGQLALAVLAHAAGDETARAEWEWFREAFIGELDARQPFTFTAHGCARTARASCTGPAPP